MTALRQRMVEDMQLRNFSPHTQDAYIRAVEQFTRHFMQPPDTLGADHARQFLLHLVEEKRVSWSTYNVTRAGLIFFFQVTLGRSERIDGVPCARTRKRVPIVLSQEELQRFFAVIRNKKHLAMFKTMYGAGLRRLWIRAATMYTGLTILAFRGGIYPPARPPLSTCWEH